MWAYVMAMSKNVLNLHILVLLWGHPTKPYLNVKIKQHVCSEMILSILIAFVAIARLAYNVEIGMCLR